MSNPERFETGRRLGCMAVGIAGAALIFLVLLLLLVAALYSYVQRTSSRLERKKGIGTKLSALELKPLTGDGQPVTLADLEGKVVLVNIWGTWCQPCRKELPLINQLYHDLADEPDFRVLAISSGPGGPEDVEKLRTQTQALLKQNGLDLPTYADPGWTTRKSFDQAAGLSVIPTTFLLDRQGVIQAIWVGYTPGLVVAVKQRVAKLLAGEEEKEAEKAEAAQNP